MYGCDGDVLIKLCRWWWQLQIFGGAYGCAKLAVSNEWSWSMEVGTKLYRQEPVECQY